MSGILRVTSAFSVLSDPNGRAYTPGMLVDADHPHVKGREHHFETVEAHVSARAGSRVESATAAPGERRIRSRRPAKKTAPKKAPVKAAKDAGGTKTPTKAPKAAQPAPDPASDASEAGGSTGEKL